MQKEEQRLQKKQFDVEHQMTKDIQKQRVDEAYRNGLKI